MINRLVLELFVLYNSFSRLTAGEDWEAVHTTDSVYQSSLNHLYMYVTYPTIIDVCRFSKKRQTSPLNIVSAHKRVAKQNSHHSVWSFTYHGWLFLFPKTCNYVYTNYENKFGMWNHCTLPIARSRHPYTMSLFWLSVKVGNYNYIFPDFETKQA